MLSSFQWCFAINNIDYVQQSIQAFVGELGMEEIVTSLANFRSQTAADHCQRTLQLVIDNALDTVGNKILELLEKVAGKQCQLWPYVTWYVIYVGSTADKLRING